MTETPEQIVERLRAAREARKPKAPLVDDGIDARLDRNGGTITVTNIEHLPSITEVMDVVEKIGASGRSVCLTFLGHTYHHGTGGDPTKTPDEVEADVKLEITAPIAFNDALMIRWHEDPMPKTTAALIQRLTRELGNK
jgi:hypothetical protein